MEAILGHLNSTNPAQLLLASIWQGVLLTACIWLVLRLASAFGLSLCAATRFRLWLSVFLLVAFLPALALLRSVVAPGPALEPFKPAVRFAIHLSPYWAFAFEGLWAAASLFCLARLVAGALQMSRFRLQSTPVPQEELNVALGALMNASGKRRIEIRLSDAIDAPSAIGFFHPAVIVPRSLWSELSADELGQIVLHEVAHLKRGDDWTNLLQKFLRALCPLNPALMWAEHHLCQERERACDDAVLDSSGNARAYAGCLTKLAESRLVRRAAALAPGLWKRRSELAGRIDNILHRRRTLSPGLSHGLLAACMLAVFSGALFLQRCPGLVAFTNGEAPWMRNAGLAKDAEPVKIVNASFEAHKNTALPQASYHDAVFHVPQNTAPAKVVKQRVAKAAKPRLRQANLYYTSSVRLINLNDGPEMGESMFTLVVFTVRAPQNSRSSRIALPVAELPAVSLPYASLPDTWIAFQI